MHIEDVRMTQAEYFTRPRRPAQRRLNRALRGDCLVDTLLLASVPASVIAMKLGEDIVKTVVLALILWVVFSGLLFSPFVFLAVVIDFFAASIFHLKHSLLLGRAPAWTLEVDSVMSALNWAYLFLTLSKRDLATAKVLAPGFVGTLGDLRVVSRGLG